jgi:DNA-binding transcriptional LysR family regulator
MDLQRLPVRDPRFLRAFHAVCTEGGFARAAERLHCTQPAVSYQIRTLEADVGTPLLLRAGRRAIPTPAGRRLLAFCQRYFSELGELLNAIGDGTALEGEPLRVATVSGFGRYVLFPALNDLLAEANTPPLHLRFRTADEVLDQVERGDADLGVVYRPRVTNLLTFHPLRDEELVLVAAGRLATSLARTRLARLANLESIPFVTYVEGDYVFGRWFEACFGAQPARNIQRHHFDELEETLATVAMGVGASIVPLDAAKPLLRRRAIRVLRPASGKRCYNRVFAVTRAGSPVPSRLREVLARLGAA